MMYGNLLDSQMGRGQDFVKRVSFAVSLTGIHIVRATKLIVHTYFLQPSSPELSAPTRSSYHGKHSSSGSQPFYRRQIAFVMGSLKGL